MDYKEIKRMVLASSLASLLTINLLHLNANKLTIIAPHEIHDTSMDDEEVKVISMSDIIDGTTYYYDVITYPVRIKSFGVAPNKIIVGDTIYEFANFKVEEVNYEDAEKCVCEDGTVVFYAPNGGQLIGTKVVRKNLLNLDDIEICNLLKDRYLLNIMEEENANKLHLI